MSLKDSDNGRDKKLASMKLQCIKQWEKIYSKRVHRMRTHLIGDAGTNKCEKMPSEIVSCNSLLLQSHKV